MCFTQIIKIDIQQMGMNLKSDTNQQSALLPKVKFETEEVLLDGL